MKPLSTHLRSVSEEVSMHETSAAWEKQVVLFISPIQQLLQILKKNKHSLKGKFSILADPLDHVVTVAEHRICFFMALVSCFHVLRHSQSWSRPAVLRFTLCKTSFPEVHVTALTQCKEGPKSWGWGSSGRRGLVLLLLRDPVTTSCFQGTISEGLWLGMVTPGSICSWMKRNKMEIWLSSLTSVSLAEDNVCEKTTIYICSVKCPCAGQTGEEKKLKPLQGFTLLPWSVRALCVFNWTKGFRESFRILKNQKKKNYFIWIVFYPNLWNLSSDSHPQLV